MIESAQWADSMKITTTFIIFFVSVLLSASFGKVRVSSMQDFWSATIFFSLKPSLANNTVRFSILSYFACQTPLKPYNFDVNFRFFENLAGIGKNLTTNIVTLANLEPNYGLMLEIKIIPNYLQVHMVSAVQFKMGHLLEKV